MTEQAETTELAARHCGECGGTDGHHLMACRTLAAENEARSDETVEASLDDGPVDEVNRRAPDSSIGGAQNRLPPSASDMADNDMLWLIAKTAYEVNRAYCASIGDASLAPWAHSEPWQRESVYIGVREHFDNPGMTPEQSHERWLEKKVADGWRYGPVKNGQLLTHPCIVPYYQLSPMQKAKDAIFTAICHAMFGTEE